MDISFTCGKCGQHLVIDEDAAGTSIDCPNCVNPVYIPSRPATSSAPAPTRVSLSITRPVTPTPRTMSAASQDIRVETETTAEVHPAIMGSLHCLVILVGLGIIGFIVVHRNMFAALAFVYMAMPFITAQVLCATYGICQGHVKHGLLMLSGLAVVIGLAYWILMASMLNAVQDSNAALQRQMLELQKQMLPFAR